eukprot:scaffold143877_cov21-Tisochrysis_lutea.AAC.3
MSGLYAAEPEMILELVALVQTEAPGLEWLRALAVRALGVQVQDRARYTAVIAGISGGAGQGAAARAAHSARSRLPGCHADAGQHAGAVHGRLPGANRCGGAAGAAAPVAGQEVGAKHHAKSAGLVLSLNKAHRYRLTHV